MTSQHDLRHMARALELARQGVGTTTPNPSVGCVLVKDGEVIGEGFTQPGGVPHAEVAALANCDDPSGATAYVSLEPCAHQGKSPPCTGALIDAGVNRVVIACSDPNPLVAGKGVEQLREAGIEVEEGVLEADAQAINAGFLKRMQTGRPRVVAKLAMSLDGRTAMASGESQWITSAPAREDVHRLRARSCAVITGVGSIVEDDSRLTVRLDGYKGRQPLRVVMDSKLRMPGDARILQDEGKTLVYCGDLGRFDPEGAQSAALTAAGAEVVSLSDADGRVDLDAALADLGERGCNDVLLECGSRLAGAFLQAGLIDELVVYMAPSLLGSDARPLIELPLTRMADKIELEPRDVRMVGNDWRFTLAPKRATRAKRD